MSFMSRLLRWLPVILWAALIFYLSSRPSLHAAQVDWLDFIIKKIAHISEYAILDGLLWFALGKKKLKLAFLMGLLYAFSDETHQLFIPGRTGTIRDVLLFDMTGLFIASLIITKLKTIYAK